MAMKLTFDNAKPIVQGIWTVEAHPDEIRMRGRGQATIGLKSIVAVSRPTYRATDHRLEIEMVASLVLNIGSSSEAYFTDLGEAELVRPGEVSPIEGVKLTV